MINEVPCRLLQRHEDFITVVPTLALDVESNEVQVRQEQRVVDKSRVFDLLSKFWLPFWQKESTVLATHQDCFESFLTHIPADTPALSVTTSDPQLWLEAIRKLKSSSARGVDAISAAEMQSLPFSAICDLQHIVMHHCKDGFPEWFMLARTFPLSKVPHTPNAGQVRPISVLAQIYRVWAAVYVVANC